MNDRRAAATKTETRRKVIINPSKRAKGMHKDTNNPL